MPPTSPVQFLGSEQPLGVPEWRNLGLGVVSPGALARNALVLGASGSGKSRSGLAPLLDAVLRYESADGNVPALLVVDPKQELREWIAGGALAAGRPPPIDLSDGHRLDLFEGFDPADPSFTADALGEVLASVSHSYRLATTRDTHQPFFHQAASRLLAVLFGVDLQLYRSGGAANVASFWLGVSGRSSPFDNYDERRYPSHLLTAARVLVGARRSQPLLDTFGVKLGARMDGTVAAEHMRELRAAVTGPEETIMSVLMTLENMLADLSDEVLRRVSLNPFQRSDCLPLMHVIEGGGIAIHSPASTQDQGANQVVGAAFKEICYRLAFRRRGDARKRGLYLVVDEAQNYVDERDAWVLDRSRAYRFTVVLATQDLSLLRLATGDDAADTVRSVWTNTGLKLVFRTPASEVVQSLQNSIPSCPLPSEPHVVSVRPPATLATGEAYVLRPDGGWGIGRVDLSPP